MISSNSSFASSTPATSAKVTFILSWVMSLALLLPKLMALVPPVCICLMKRTQTPMSNSIGIHEMSAERYQGDSSFGLAMIETFFAVRRSTSLGSSGV